MHVPLTSAGGWSLLECWNQLSLLQYKHTVKQELFGHSLRTRESFVCLVTSFDCLEFVRVQLCKCGASWVKLHGLSRFAPSHRVAGSGQPINHSPDISAFPFTKLLFSWFRDLWSFPPHVGFGLVYQILIFCLLLIFSSCHFSEKLLLQLLNAICGQNTKVTLFISIICGVTGMQKMHKYTFQASQSWKVIDVLHNYLIDTYR